MESSVPICFFFFNWILPLPFFALIPLQPPRTPSPITKRKCLPSVYLCLVTKSVEHHTSTKCRYQPSIIDELHFILTIKVRFWKHIYTHLKLSVNIPLSHPYKIYHQTYYITVSSRQFVSSCRNRCFSVTVYFRGSLGGIYCNI